MSGLKLVPNEFVGYRVKPDYYNWTVVALKRHGVTSQNAGQVYETPVGYYRSLTSAFGAILNLESRVQIEAAQREEAAQRDDAITRGIESPSEDFCSHRSLLAAFQKAELAVKHAAESLERDLQSAGVTVHDLAKHFKGGASIESESPEQ